MTAREPTQQYATTLKSQVGMGTATQDSRSQTRAPANSKSECEHRESPTRFDLVIHDKTLAKFEIRVPVKITHLPHTSTPCACNRCAWARRPRCGKPNIATAFSNARLAIVTNHQTKPAGTESTNQQTETIANVRLFSRAKSRDSSSKA